MASVKICDGRTVVYQYDTGVSIELCDCRDFTECHFAVNDGIIRRDVEDNICSVPDAALVNAGTLTVYAFSRNDDGGQTQHTFFIHVMARPKPADYIDPPDEADYIDLIAERAAKVLPLFIVHTEWVDGVLRADKLPWEIDAAADKGHACVMVYASNTLAYCGRKEKHPAFIGQPAKKTNGMFYVDVAYVLDDGTVDITPSSYIAAMTAKPLVFKGAVNATFTGTETTYVTIPDGGVSQEEIEEAVDKALTEAKESGEFDGASGKDGKDGVDGKDGKDGKDGISVTITNITQSTEDDGYSVVTFSDGKQLRVKNGSKGSPGEGGSGGSTSKYAQPDWGVEHVENYAYMPETELTVIEDIGVALVMSEVAGVTAGGSYTVIYNGTEYVCEAVNTEGTGIVLGNAGAMIEGAPTTEEPFLIMMINEADRESYMGAYVMVAPFDGSATFTLAIVGEKDIVYAIPAKYLEAASKPLIVSVNLELTESDTDFATIHEAAFAGRLVYLKWDTEIRALSTINESHANFTRVTGTADDGANNITVQTVTIRSDNTISTVMAQLNDMTVN